MVREHASLEKAIQALDADTSLSGSKRWAEAAAGVESEREPVTKRIEKKEFIRRLAERTQTDEATAAQWLDSVLEEMYQTFRSGHGLTLPGFGGFYLEPKRESWAFKFNPGQKLRALFGWSSSYRGPL